MSVPDQCRAILPNDRRGHFNDGWLCCSLREGHEGAHRTCYNPPWNGEGDPAWTFDVAAVEALPSPYLNLASRALR